MIWIKLKFENNKFVSTCCSEEVEMGVLEPGDVLHSKTPEEDNQDDEDSMHSARDEIPEPPMVAG
jgi:hypothetical protein